jgi:hypothetical protein
MRNEPSGAGTGSGKKRRCEWNMSRSQRLGNLCLNLILPRRQRSSRISSIVTTVGPAQRKNYVFSGTRRKKPYIYYMTCRHRLMVRPPGFHPGSRGSIPRGGIAVSSNGKTLVFGTSYRGSNPCTAVGPRGGIGIHRSLKTTRLKACRFESCRGHCHESNPFLTTTTSNIS